jgi:very-short-patch-repair endonuclease
MNSPANKLVALQEGLDGSERVRRIFEFVRSLQELRTPVQRDLDSTPWKLWLKDVPAHPAVSMAAAVTEDESLETEVLRCQRPTYTKPPAPSAALADWVLPGWNDPSIAPRHRPAVNRAEGSAQAATERFEEDLERTAAWELWVGAWNRWAEAEQPSIRTMKLFESLYALLGQLERDGDDFELVLGEGVLMREDGRGRIEYPLLVQRLELSFDPKSLVFRIQTRGEPELNTALIRAVDGLEVRHLASAREELVRSGIRLLGGGETSGYLKSLISSLASDGELSDRSEATADGKPRVARAPVLFLRSRKAGAAQALSAIVDDLRATDEIPSALLKIAGVHETPSPVRLDEARTSEAVESSSNVLLSKPANAEQVEIIQKLERFGAVIVQGPPGTGKTHTIANLLGHLLATGKTVLVTSHTTKALRVLRDKVVEPLQSLCVSVLDKNTESRAQLDLAVTEIATRLSTSDPDRLQRDGDRLVEERAAILHRLTALRADLLRARGDEYREILVAGRGTSPSDAAKRVAAAPEETKWIPGPVQPGAPLPLSSAELDELYRTNFLVTPSEEAELVRGVPERDALLGPEKIDAHLAQLSSSKPFSRVGTDRWQTAAPDDTITGLKELAERIDALARQLKAMPVWQLGVLQASLHGAEEAKPWTSLLGLLRSWRAELVRIHTSLLEHGPRLAAGVRSAEQLTVAEDLIAHLESGGGLGKMTLLVHPTWRKLINSWTVASGAPETVEHFRALRDRVLQGVLGEQLRERWARQVTTLGGPPPDVFDADVLGTLKQFAAELEELLAWPSRVWTPLLEALGRIGIQFEEVLALLPPDARPHGDLRRRHACLEGPIGEIVSNRTWLLERSAAQAEIENAVRTLEGSVGQAIASRMAQALRAKDGQRYRELYERALALNEKSPVLRRRSLLLERIEQDAPRWAAEIRERVGIHGEATLPSSAEIAWELRQLSEELDRRQATDLQAMQRELEAAQNKLRTVTARLIEARAWQHQLRRTTDPQKQTLVTWLNLMKRIGKGTGKRAKQLVREAERALTACRPAVPVWIMPVSEVLQSVRPADRFDVVIIDEASQADLLSLVPMYLGRRVVVVGDHEQVSPSAVGEEIDGVDVLIEEHLQGIPGRKLYDGRRSIYDLAREAFSASVCLTEHFRCVPDIIEFSNTLSYGGRIKPLREAADSALRPAVLAHRVEGLKEGKKNRVEAETVASLVCAAVKLEEYRGKSFGVVSLLGDEQAVEIERLLRNRLDAEDLRERRILCGSPAHFQGDERDVIFLSMVDSPSGGPLALREQENFKQRYNVAVSRARDQLWVVHSLNPTVDLKAGDLRRRLLEYCADPSAVRQRVEAARSRFDSVFEEEIFERLVRAGYRVTPQWEVGRFRIDLVVEGSQRRLAVECDGEKFHPPEQLQADMDRQAILERLGWTFVRIRGSAYFRNKEAAVGPLFERLEQLGIETGLEPVQGSAAQAGSIDNLVRRAHELQSLWRTEAESKPASEARGRPRLLDAPVC